MGIFSGHLCLHDFSFAFAFSSSPPSLSKELLVNSDNILNVIKRFKAVSNLN